MGGGADGWGSADPVFQAKSKFCQARPNSAGAKQKPSKKNPWISFDFLVRIERFQCVALTPQAIFFFLPSAAD
jgi:hypothetical protein